MVALRLPVLSRLMVFEVRLESVCRGDYFPTLVSEHSLEELHHRTMARKTLLREQLALEREKLYSGSMMLR